MGTPVKLKKFKLNFFIRMDIVNLDEDLNKPSKDLLSTLFWIYLLFLIPHLKQ